VASVQHGEVIHMQSFLSLFPIWLPGNILQQINVFSLFLGLFNDVSHNYLQKNLETHVIT
jgi:hypothetical protein